MSDQRKTQSAAGTGVPLLERPLTARSVVLSLLLGRRPARARVGLLVRWCGELGISENAARVALSRMVERGELTAGDGVYELAGRVRGRQAEHDVALDPPTGAWSGQWHVVMVAATGRAATDRATLRDVLRRARLGEVREGIWVRPDNLVLPSADPLFGSHVSTWRGAPSSEAPAALAERLFSLSAHAARTVELVAALASTARSIDDGELGGAFVVGAAALQHLRRDPLLPRELLPPGWPGAELRAAYLGFQQRFSDAIAHWYRAA